MRPVIELRFEQRHRRIVARPCPDAAEHRLRNAPLTVDAHAPLAFAGHEALERELDPAHRVAPLAAHQHVVALVDLTIAQLRMEARQRRTLLGDEQHAGRVAVEPVHELEKACVGSGVAQPLDDAELDAAAAVHREARRLVERDQRIVLVEDWRQRHCGGCGRLRRPREGAAARTGGTRTRSPAARRASGPTRRPLSLTSPLRRIR